MSVPSYDRLIEPLLRFLAKNRDGAQIEASYEAVASAVHLSDADRLQLLPSGKTAVYKNRIGWAHDRLKRAGLSSSPRRGVWKLTAEGLAVAKKSPLTEAAIERLANVDRASGLPREEPETIAGPTVSVESPDDRIEHALAELRESVAHDLLERIGQASPRFFENLVLELLHAMGYGARLEDAQRVGGSGDGGIDGIISLDRLGLEKVYVQAKRWQATVGSPAIQAFMGALQLQGASKGVFLTTSLFTKDARDAASKARGTIVLVDGERLAALMIEHGVGVTHKMVKAPKIDGDYFEDG